VRVRAASGELVPLQAVADIEMVTAPLFGRPLQQPALGRRERGAAPGYSPRATAIAAMEKLVDRAPCPRATASNGPARRCRKRQAGGQTGFILGLAVLFAYLFLVGLYESWRFRWRRCCRSSSACSGAMTALLIAGLDNNIYAQIGIVVLIALAAKNAILIIEFAMAERARGADVVDAATTAANLRFRAVMMTSFAFILAWCRWSSPRAPAPPRQRAVGTAVFGGMIAASFLGIFVIPGLYVAFQRFRETVKGWIGGTGTKTK
jgi:multidrug efflux pump subunit AcrB